MTEGAGTSEGGTMGVILGVGVGGGGVVDDWVGREENTEGLRAEEGALKLGV